ncbi:MAG TPA: DUF6398 domain-containing protein [Longimicrobium sp.]|nr:DUF6398 domain-containing protein [Longimicrobium sp.]
MARSRSSTTSPESAAPDVEVPRSVPVAVRPRYAELVRLTDAACRQGLNEEYAQLSRKAAEVLSRKRPSPLLGGRAPGWACGIVYALGQVNFLFDRSTEPYLSSGELSDLFGVSAATAAGKAKEVRRILKTRVMDPEWTLPSAMDRNIMAWLVSIDGLLVDARTLPLAYQMALAEAGYIPYVPNPGEDEE